MTREEAIKIVKEFINGTCLHLVDQEALKTLIPELKESEDERIRKWLFNYIENCPNENFEFYGGVGKKAVLSWIEKQKEQKIEAKLTGWVTRDSEHDPYLGLGLFLFKGKPRRSGDCWCGTIASQLPWDLFPDLKWKDEPVEVEVTIRRK